MSKASPNITIKQSTDASGVTTVELEQSAIGMKAEDQFDLDWNPATFTKGPLGEVERMYFHVFTICSSSDCSWFAPSERCRFYRTPDLDFAAVSNPDSRAFLAGGTETSAWLEDPTEKHIQVVEKDPKGQWTLEQVWGFGLLDGKRYHTKRLVAMNGKKEALVRLVYDYVGPL
jgi:hypothetical protein